MTTLTLEGLDALITALGGLGYEVHGPRAVGGVIAPDRIESVDDLPLGWTDEQSGGQYRLRPRADQARFGYAVGPRSWKEILHPARTPIWTMERTPAGEGTPVELRVRMHEPAVVARAFVGVRPCELAAIARQDRVLAHGPHPDPTYGANRAANVIVAVNCAEPAATCFCPSQGTGPRAVAGGYDIALTELVEPTADAADASDAAGAAAGPEPRYVVEVGSLRGAELLSALPAHCLADDPHDEARAASVTDRAAAAITRSVESEGIKELLYESLESDRWEAVAQRCLTCANCTLACPTCFCTDLEDVTDLTGNRAERWRVWDSCFSLAFSQLGPAPQRSSAASRYRQWLVHKMGSWHDQFGESGCVGCGRCITWCPVGIDLTEELAALRQEAS
ncbi:MAG: 4Fe-4S dicluster domain-containing protein [Acidimicrobiales bacterium]